MTNINRQQAGTKIAGRSAGGEFAPTTRHEAQFTEPAQQPSPERDFPTPDWGAATLTDAGAHDGASIQLTERVSLEFMIDESEPDYQEVYLNITDDDGDQCLTKGAGGKHLWEKENLPSIVKKLQSSKSACGCFEHTIDGEPANISELSTGMPDPAPRTRMRDVPRKLFRGNPDMVAYRDEWAENLEVFDRAADLAVADIVDGKLANGVAGNAAVDSVEDWIRRAESSGNHEFAEGARDTIRHMYAHHDGDPFETARTKRASKASREHWAHKLHISPSNNHWRGMLTAGLALANTEDWWGVRKDPARTISHQQELNS